MADITGPSSRLMRTNIGDLPEEVLEEILGRLPCYKHIARCKCVSKRWCTVMSRPSFIRQFLCFQSDTKQTTMIRTLISSIGEEFLARMSSSFKPLSPLFKRLMNLYHLKEEPFVVGSYNDLVLCCASRFKQRDYFICNPYTLESVPPPPPPQVTNLTVVGIFCDHPYYKCKRSDLGGHDTQINAEYRCRVVRLLLHYPSEMDMPQRQFKVQIFSSETGVWRESIVSSPSSFEPYNVALECCITHNGMLYWLGLKGSFVIGLDPFMMDKRNSATTSSIISSMADCHASDHYEILYTEIDEGAKYFPVFLGVYKGCLQLGAYMYDSHSVTVWELREKFLGESGKLCFEQRRRAYSLPYEMGPFEDYFVDLLGFDPSNDGTEGEGIFYLGMTTTDTHGDIFMCNISTGKFSKILENHPLLRRYYRVAVPWWPTPVPRLPDGEANALIYSCEAGLIYDVN